MERIDAIVRRLELRLAESEADLATVLDLRRAGYGGDYVPASFPEELDVAPNAAVLLVWIDGLPCATARILDGTRGPIELDRFIRVASVVPPGGYAEMTRLVARAVSPELRQVVLMSIYKAYLNYCSARRISTMIVSAKAELATNYLAMGFADVGDAGAYVHASLGATPHRTYTLDLHDLEQTLRRLGQHALATFLFERSHPNSPWSA